MPRKSTQGNRSRRNVSRGGSSRSRANETNVEKSLNLNRLRSGGYKKIAKNVSKNPLALYLASGLGAFFLGRFVYRYYQNHPEISDFIQENFDTVESKLREFRSGRGLEEERIARH